MQESAASFLTESRNVFFFVKFFIEFYKVGESIPHPVAVVNSFSGLADNLFTVAAGCQN